MRYVGNNTTCISRHGGTGIIAVIVVLVFGDKCDCIVLIYIITEKMN